MNPVAGFGEIGMGLLRAVRPWDEWIAGWGFNMADGEPDLSEDTVLAKLEWAAMDGSDRQLVEPVGSWPARPAAT